MLSIELTSLPYVRTVIFTKVILTSLKTTYYQKGILQQVIVVIRHFLNEIKKHIKNKDFFIQ